MRVLVIGAGLAGLSAARALKQLEYDVIVLEARQRTGGRCWTNQGVELGAQWIHSTEGNPISVVARELGLPTMFVGGDSTYLGGWDQLTLLDQSSELTADAKQRSILAADAMRDLLDDLRRRDLDANAPDRSMREAIDHVLNELTLTNAERDAIEWHMALLVRDDCAADEDELSFLWWDDGYEVYGYGDSVLTDGYSALVEALAADLDIRLGHVVTCIDSGGPGVRITTAANGVFEADAAIVTLPLGVLKSNAVAFRPSLPHAKRAAIERLGIGTLNKVIAHFETPFWPPQQYAFGCVGRPLDRAPTCILSMWKTHRLPALVMAVGGALAHAVESWTEAELHSWTLEVLRDAFGPTVPEPGRIERTCWRADPFARGAYSFIAVGSTPAAIDALAEPIDNRLFFAGEATARQHWATAQSAVVSGLREAARLSQRPDMLPPRHFTENRRWRAMTQRANRFLNMRGRAVPRAELDERLHVLRRNPIFGAVPPPELELLASMFEARSFDDGEVICQAGAPATAMYVMVSGAAHVDVAGRSRHLERGDSFGEYGMFGQRTRSATVSAIGQIQVLELDYQRFERFLLAFPESMKALLDTTVQRLLAFEFEKAI